MSYLRTGVIAALLGVSPGVPAQDSVPKYEFHIPPQTLGSALAAFAHETGFEVARFSAQSDHAIVSSAVVGVYTAQQGLEVLLRGTGLTYRVVNPRTFAIVRAEPAQPPAPPQAPEPTAPEAPAKKPSVLFRVFSRIGAALAVCGAAAAGGGTACADEPQPGTTAGLEEIVVTAEKYNSTIQNTPISMSAFSGDQLTAAGITTVEDLSHEVPGLSMRSAGPGQTEYEARGIASTAGASPTVGFYLDEIPLSPPAQAQIGKVVIDPDLYDVNRVELLRGPQGTLYGSGSMGGTVKVITNQPKLGTFEASFQGTLSDTDGGSGNGGGSFMLNFPLADTLALRVVGSDTYRSGWIDRVVVSPFPQDGATTRGNVLAAPVQSVTTNVNTESLYGGRASLLFQPDPDFSIVAMALLQRMHMGAYDEFDDPPGSAYMAHYEAFNIPEPIDDTAHVYSLTATANLGFADLTSASGYFERHLSQTQDASESVSYVTGIYPYVAVPYSEVDPSRQFSQELRLTSRGNERLHWAGGVFYSDLTSDWIEFGANPAFVSLSPPGENPNGASYQADNPFRLRQYAVFGDGSYNFTDNWTFEAGLRWYRYQDALYINERGYYAPVVSGGPTVTVETSNSGFNPRFNLSYRPNSDLTAYASASKGFRPGGPNQTVAAICNIGKTPSFGPDSLWNYEVGEKARFLDGRLSINSDLFYIKWSGVQQNVLLNYCGSLYTGNAGNARSFGPELEINAKLAENWTLSANASYTDAKITEPSASFAAGAAGSYYTCPTAGNCTLPILNVPKDAGSLALLYSTDVSRGYLLKARLSVIYVGTAIDQAASYFTLPSYTIASARVGLSNDRWSATLFVNNLTNKVAWNTANNTEFQYNIPVLTRISMSQPRTYGTEVDYHF
jgi:iron complex outermembrane recepter protein